jgi:hypothetical protein
MAHSHLRLLSCLAAALLIFPLPSSAFDTPLSDTAVREAYFLGQRHDDSYNSFMEKYTRQLPAPETGPYISSVTFLTPFALVVRQSAEHSFNYSEQQAQIDHRNRPEMVRVLIEIQLTNSYPAIYPSPDIPGGLVQRQGAFWKDFRIQVVSGQTALPAVSYDGHPHYSCGSDGACILSGATVQLEFRADKFTDSDAVVHIEPPEGDDVDVDFSLSDFR